MPYISETKALNKAYCYFVYARNFNLLQAVRAGIVRVCFLISAGKIITILINDMTFRIYFYTGKVSKKSFLRKGGLFFATFYTKTN